MRFLLLTLALLLLAACVPPPVDDGKDNQHRAPVIFPDTIKKPRTTIKLPESVKPLPPASHATQPKALPQGWTLVDPKGIIQTAGYAPDLGGVLLTVDKESGLGLFSAEDNQHHSYYKGMVDGAHLITLPKDNDSDVLIVFNNRKNARFSVLLKH